MFLFLCIELTLKYNCGIILVIANYLPASYTVTFVIQIP